MTEPAARERVRTGGPGRRLAPPVLLRSSRLIWQVVLLALLTCPAPPALAQQSGRAADVIVLPPEHWVYDVLHRLDAAALAPRGFDPAAGNISAAEAVGVLAAAAARAESAPHSLRFMLPGYLERLRAEYAAVFRDSVPAVAVNLRLSPGLTAHRKPLRARADTSGARSAADTTLAAFAGLRGGATLGGRIQVEADLLARSDGLQLRELYTAARLGSVGLWAGRRRIGFLTAAGGDVVLGRTVAWDGAGVWLTRPWTLPLLGPLRFESFLALADSNGMVDEPWFWSARATVEPAPRLSVGITRAIMFGDTTGARRVDWAELTKIIVGQNQRPYAYPDNQIVAVDARWQAPTDPLPLELYLSWGAEDSSGAWWVSPAIVAGIFAPVLPGAAGLAVGLEHAVFSGGRGHGHFYRHRSFTGGWTQSGIILGHPLGGTGQEWLLYGMIDHGVAGPALSWRGFRRVRASDNRFAPAREGESWGGAAQLRWFLTRQLGIHAAGGVEGGAGWTTGSAAVQLELVMGGR